MRKEIKDKKVGYVLKNYLPRIKEIFNPKEIWLWGSRASGQAGPYSDIDLIVVSDRFKRIRFIKRRSTFLKKSGLLYDQKAEVVDALCYTPEEFERKKNDWGIVSEALKKGIRIL